MMKHTFQINRTLLLLSRLLLSAGVVFVLTQCNNDEDLSQEGAVPLDSISAFTIPPYLSEGQIVRIVLEPHPEAARLGGMQRVLWTSSDTSVAKIQANSSGLVAVIVGQTTGQATILTTLANDTTKRNTAKTEVVKEKIDNVALNFEGGAKPTSRPAVIFEAVLAPKEASIKEVIWSSSDNSVAEVVNVIREENGNYTPTASAQGTATLVNDTLRAYAQVTAGTNIGETQIVVTSKEGQKKAIKIVETRPQGSRMVLSFYDVCPVVGRNRAEDDSRESIADEWFPTATVVRTAGGITNIDYRGDNPASNSNYYTFFPNQILTIDKGAKFDLTIAQRAGRSFVWIDWNGDEDFEEAGEIINAFGPAQGVWAPGVQGDSREITVPDNIEIKGKVRMRVVTGDAWNYADIEDPSLYFVKRPDVPCGNITRIASIKDFVVNIK